MINLFVAKNFKYFEVVRIFFFKFPNFFFFPKHKIFFMKFRFMMKIFAVDQSFSSRFFFVVTSICQSKFKQNYTAVNCSFKYPNCRYWSEINAIKLIKRLTKRNMPWNACIKSPLWICNPQFFSYMRSFILAVSNRNCQKSGLFKIIIKSLQCICSVVYACLA